MSVRGKPYPTKQVIHLVRDWGIRATDLRPALFWNGGPIGVAETYYPHPKGWKLAGSNHPNLERMSVRKLTAAFRALIDEEPTCVKTWPPLVGGVDMGAVGRRFTSPLITPRDFKNYYRIVHRSMRTRNVVRDAPALECRLCGKALERFSHLAKCEEVRAVMSEVWKMSLPLHPSLNLDDGFIYLGRIDKTAVLSGALSAIHIIAWKFIVIAFTQVETKGVKFSSSRVWQQAVRRFEGRVDAYAAGLYVDARFSVRTAGR